MRKTEIAGGLLLALALCLLSGCGKQTAEVPAASAVDAFGRHEKGASAQTRSPQTEAPHGEAATPGLTTPPSPVPSPVQNAALSPSPAPKPLPDADGVFVRVTDYIPGIVVDLKYAGEDNFTGTTIYTFPSTEAWLRCGTVRKLAEAEAEAEADGFRLKIWDAFRPVSAQFRLWEVCPDPVYVANPNQGYSSHSKGNTVDITLVTERGEALVMPTGFDDFTAKADRDYSDCTQEERENAEYLQALMVRCGFVPYSGEWWHFSDSDSYPVETAFAPGRREEQG